MLAAMKHASAAQNWVDARQPTYWKERRMRLETRWTAAVFAILAMAGGCTAPKPEPAKSPTTNSAAPAAIDRTVLPIQEPDYPHETELDARKATPPPRFEVKAPDGAPNVLIVLIDDMGSACRAPSVGRSTCRRSIAWRRKGCATTSSTRPRSARRRGRRCSAAATTT